LIGNSGNFVGATPLIWGEAGLPFREFMRLCDWLHGRLGRQHGIALAELGEMLLKFFTEEKGLPAERIAEVLWRDYQAGGRSDMPLFLRPYLSEAVVSGRDRLRSMVPKRQQRHLAQKT